MDLRILFGIVAACDDGVFEGLDESQGEYKRRLANGFGTVDGFGGGVFEERQAEVFGFGNCAVGRDFVGRGRMGLEGAVGAPDEFFAAEPAVALGKCAFDLAAVDARDDGIADVVNRFDVAELVFAGERVEFDFEHADAIGIVGGSRCWRCIGHFVGTGVQMLQIINKQYLNLINLTQLFVIRQKHVATANHRTCKLECIHRFNAGIFRTDLSGAFSYINRQR